METHAGSFPGTPVAGRRERVFSFSQEGMSQGKRRQSLA
jgi:hypothetical protein